MIVLYQYSLLLPRHGDMTLNWPVEGSDVLGGSSSVSDSVAGFSDFLGGGGADFLATGLAGADFGVLLTGAGFLAGVLAAGVLVVGVLAAGVLAWAGAFLAGVLGFSAKASATFADGLRWRFELSTFGIFNFRLIAIADGKCFRFLKNQTGYL